METFVNESSIIRRIWGTTDITLFIFAGAAAEFALNKQVDWLYFTGKLPADPIGRMFSTIQYAQQIIFNNEKKALDSIAHINDIHHSVESARHRKIPATSYKDVLFMLIHYSVTSFELAERKLTPGEKDEVVDTFKRMGILMHMEDLPGDYLTWMTVYDMHLQWNLENSSFTKDLFKQYRKHLGAFRYFILLEIQRLLAPAQVKDLLKLGKPVIAHRFIWLYKLLRKLGLHNPLIEAMVPKKFRAQARAMRHL